MEQAASRARANGRRSGPCKLSPLDEARAKIARASGQSDLKKLIAAFNHPDADDDVSGELSKKHR